MATFPDKPTITRFLPEGKDIGLKEEIFFRLSYLYPRNTNVNDQFVSDLGEEITYKRLTVAQAEQKAAQNVPLFIATGNAPDTIVGYVGLTPASTSQIQEQIASSTESLDKKRAELSSMVIMRTRPQNPATPEVLIPNADIPANEPVVFETMAYI